MADQVTLEYQRDVIGHPPAGTVLTVERTDQTDALLNLGIAVDTSSPDLQRDHADGAIHPDPGPDDDGLDDVDDGGDTVTDTDGSGDGDTTGDGTGDGTDQTGDDPAPQTAKTRRAKRDDG